MNHRRSALWLASSIAVLACGTGCKDNGKEGEATPAASASAAPSAAPPAPTVAEKPRGPERGPGHGGVDAILFRAARELPLSDAQKAQLSAIEGKLRDRETDPRDAMKAFSGDLATQVRAGKLDPSKLQPDEAALDTAMKGMLDKQATALGGLHDALDPGQRKALADAVHAKQAAREADAKNRAGDASDWIARKLDRMTSDLALDPGQQKQIGALLAKQPDPSAARDDMKKQMDAILTAFQADSFDAAKVLQATTKAPHEALDRQIALTTQLLTVLHPDQRERLAVSTSRPPPRGGWSPDDEEGHGGGGGGGGGGTGGGGGD